MKLSARAAGYDQDKEKLRAAILAEESRYRECARHGVGRSAQTLDHVIPIRAAPERRLDPINLKPLCSPCHHKKTYTRDDGFGHRGPIETLLHFGQPLTSRSPSGTQTRAELRLAQVTTFFWQLRIRTPLPPNGYRTKKPQ